MILKKIFQRICFAYYSLLFSCSLERDIDINLPPYNRQLVVECYLEENQPIKLLLTETTSYFDSLKDPSVNNAEVFIQSNGQTFPIPFDPLIDPKFVKYYNFRSITPLTVEPGQDLSLQIKDNQGRVINGKTKVLPKPVIDSVKYNVRLPDSSANLVVWIKDDPSINNYYRLIVNKDSLNSSSSLDFEFTDNQLNGKTFPVGTGYRFKVGEKLIIRLINIEQQYYQYLETIEDAENANGNPFAQPGSIISSVEGGFGIFTFLNQVVKEVEIKL